MIKVIILLLIGQLLWLPSPTVAQSGINQYGSDYFKMSDRSAIKLCMLLDGTYSWVEPQDETRGAKCSFEAKVWTANNKHAKEFCASKVPFYITEAENDASTGRTRCTFQVNLKCADSWVQIKNRCYMATSVKFNQTQLNTTCTPYVPVANSPAELATVYSSSLLPFFEELLPEVTTAWLKVSDMNSYFENVNATDDKAVFVVNGHLYDVEAASLVQDFPEKKHHVLCEYSPGVTMAELIYLAKQYDTIYPLFITPEGASFSTASYATVTHSGGSQYDVKALDDQCKAIGKIFGVDSNIYSSFEQPFSDIKDKLVNHRFHLTAGVKDNNCKLGGYTDRNIAGTKPFPGKTYDGYCDAHSVSFAKGGRYPTKAAMRSPVLCNFEAVVYEKSECGSDWATSIRTGGAVYCHKNIEGTRSATTCHSEGAELAGFDSEAEVRHVWKTLKLGGKHYTLGGLAPCDPLAACWLKDAASNNALIEQFRNRNGYWREDYHVFTVLFNYPSSGKFEFHTHYDPYEFICGKYGTMTVKKKKISK